VALDFWWGEAFENGGTLGQQQQQPPSQAEPEIKMAF
jgi:hypothetical protein